MGTAKPMPMNVPAAVGFARATTMPTVSPLPLSSGPPELPEFTAASNWMSPARLAPSGPRARRFRPENPADQIERLLGAAGDEHVLGSGVYRPGHAHMPCDRRAQACSRGTRRAS